MLAKRDNAIEAPRCSELVDDNRHFESTGNANELDVRVGSAMLAQAMQGTLDQRLDDEVVEARRDDGEAPIPDDPIALRGFYLVHVLPLLGDVFDDLYVEARDRVHLLGCR